MLRALCGCFLFVWLSLCLATTASAQSSPNFTVSATPMAASVAVGGSARFTLTAAPTAGFIGAVAFSCNAPAGITCQFTPASVSLSGAMGTSQLVATAASNGGGGGGGGYIQHMGMVLATSLGLFGTIFLRRKRSSPSQLRWVGVLLLLALSLGLAGCGYTSPVKHGTAAVVVNAQSGALVHSVTLSLTVM